MLRKWTMALFLLSGLALASAAHADPPLADVAYHGSSIEFSPGSWGHGFILTVAAPDGSVIQKTVKNGAPGFDLSELDGAIMDGRYNFELRLVTSPPRKRSDEVESQGIAGIASRPVAPSQSGSFLVSGGSIVPLGGLEPMKSQADLAKPQGGGPDSPMDYLIYDDLIVTGSFCVGFDCQDGESFGFDTIKLKEHNLRIYFEDTSYTASYPTNDWRITANASTNGGLSYLAVEDVTGGRTPFLIEAGSPSHSLYVEDYGRVGFGTSTPVVELHVRDSDTPTLRLEQDGSGGWTPQTWDVAGNESNFFIRDATNGSKLPFRIQPSTPSSTLCLKSDGKVGVGTWSPSYTMEVETTNENSAVVVQRTDGATNYINATASFGNFGTVTNHPTRVVVNGTWQMRVNSDSSITMRNGASLTPGGVWTNASSRALKQEIASLSIEEAMVALTGLSPVKFAYKSNGERHVGFIAEDAPELVAGMDRDGLSPMDVVAVLTKVVQEQEQRIQEQQRHNEEQQQLINLLWSRVAALESR